MSSTTPHDSSDPRDDSDPRTDGVPASPDPQEVVLNDGESITFTAPTDGTTHIVVNVAPPQRSTGFFSSCLQGCGCLVFIVIALAFLGSFAR